MLSCVDYGVPTKGRPPQTPLIPLFGGELGFLPSLVVLFPFFAPALLAARYSVILYKHPPAYKPVNWVDTPYRAMPLDVLFFCSPAARDCCFSLRPPPPPTSLFWFHSPPRPRTFFLSSIRFFHCFLPFLSSIPYTLPPRLSPVFFSPWKGWGDACLPP